MNPDAALNHIATVLYKNLITQGVPPTYATIRVGKLVAAAFSYDKEKRQ